MGCSSGRLTGAGAAAHTGAVAAYLASGSPCVVANLWDVTDRDIDAFTTSLLSRRVPARALHGGCTLAAHRQFGIGTKWLRSQYIA